MIRRIWLQQPIAFARVGGSQTPLSAFRWTQPDLRPRGTGRTTIAPAPTFEVDPTSGTLSLVPDSEFTLFKDEKGLRPVCPFFELHGEWDARAADQSTALTMTVVEANGLSLSKLTWDIRHANHKAYSLTGSEGDRLEAQATLRGDDHARRDLIGSSPQGAANPLVPRDPGIKMGAIQAVRPTAEYPEIRFRFYAPPGHAYGPTNLPERLTKSSDLLDRLIALLRLNADWADFRLPAERCILNANSAWPRYKLVTYGELIKAVPRIVAHPRAFLSLCRHVQRSELLRFLLGPTGDAGKLPPGLFAWRFGGGALLSSLGLVDDLGDGVITCSLDGVGQARARIAVGPPHFSPDRRPPVTIADALTDRTQRADVRSPDWMSQKNWPSAEAEIDDLLDRAFETAALSNLDAWNEELRSENQSDAVYRRDATPPLDPGGLLWPDRSQETVLDLPLTEQGRWRHRRNAADEFFEQLIRETPELLKDWIRDPDDAQSLYYDRRMPALMRGPDRRPLHLTRRQLSALRKWAEQLRARQRGRQK